MFNGLNECAKYDFYDVMGAQFAEHGIATILLPTPFHLSRRVPRDNKCTALRSMIKQSKTRDYEMPTDIAFGNEALYLYNFKRSIKELENLVDRIRHPFMDDYGFFHTYFTQDPQITLFGFSLGGLRALACFLRNPDSYHSCITFNSTVNLGEINTEALNLNPKVWKETFSAIGDLVDKGDFILGQKNDEDILNLFRWLYLKGTKDKLANRLKEHSTKYLSIQSGADPLAKDENAMGGNISVRDHGLNRYIVAGVGHVPTRDLRWDNWLSKVGETIVHFIKGCEEVHWPHAELEGIIYELIKETPFFKNLKRKKKLNFENFDFSFKVFEDLKGQIRELGTDEDVDRFVELYYISKAFYPKFAELLEKILK